MIKAALCDDEKAQLAQLETLLDRYRSCHPDADLSVTAFSSGIDLLEHLRAKGTFDLYLLDVIMPGIDGIELGVSIREIDQGGHIIYLTSSPDFAIDSYQAKASGYLLKPPDKDRLFQTLDSVTAHLTQERRAFVTIKTRDGLRRLSFQSIIYGELVGRCIHYHLTDGSVMTGTSLRGPFRDAVGPLLENPPFVLCATSFFVNLSYVEKIETSCLRLASGTPLPLSRSFRAEVTNRWLDYHLGGGDAGGS